MDGYGAWPFFLTFRFPLVSRGKRPRAMSRRERIGLSFRKYSFASRPIRIGDPFPPSLTCRPGALQIKRELDKHARRLALPSVLAAAAVQSSQRAGPANQFYAQIQLFRAICDFEIGPVTMSILDRKGSLDHVAVVFCGNWADVVDFWARNRFVLDRAILAERFSEEVTPAYDPLVDLGEPTGAL